MPAVAPTSTPAKPRFAGIFERRTDAVAFAAFMLAFAGAIVQVFAFVRGAEVNLRPPDSVVVFFDTQANGDVIVRVAALMSYVNAGAPGYGATVVDESVTFNFGDKTYSQQWESFEKLDRKGTQLNFYNQGDAQPTAVAGGSVASHTTAFVPQLVRCTTATCNPYANSLKKDDFLKGLNMSALSFQFSAAVDGGRKPLSTSCSIDVTDAMVAILSLNNWYATQCFPASDG